MIGQYGKHQKNEPLKKTLVIILFILVSVNLLLLISFNILKRVPIFSESNTPESLTKYPYFEEQGSGPLVIPDSDSFSRREKCFTFLIAASDQSSGNADTIMVVTFDTIQNIVGIVSIPRDTLIDPDNGYSSYPKINSTYLKGVENLSAAISDLLGIPIDYYVTVDINGFIELIDTIGGIDFNIPVHMSYDDPKQNLHIHFEPGLTHLNGIDTMKVCRLRDNNDGTLAYPDYDIGRTRIQQQIMIAVAKKVLSSPQKINEYVEIFAKYIETNLSLGNVLWLTEPFLSLNIEEDVKSATLPGDGTVSYRNARYCYELFPEEALSIVNELINPFTKSLEIEDMNIFNITE